MSQTTHRILVGQKKDPRASMRRTPQPDNPRLKESRPRRSTYLGMLFFLQTQDRLSPGNLRFVRGLQSKVKFEELYRAVNLCSSLQISRKSAARAEQELSRIQRNCPILPAKSKRREQRRIGVGYRDKGSLRAKHEDHWSPPRMWWSGDLFNALLQPPKEPRWISAEEIFGPKQYSHIQDLSLRQLAGVFSGLEHLAYRKESEDPQP